MVVLCYGCAVLRWLLQQHTVTERCVCVCVWECDTDSNTDSNKETDVQRWRSTRGNSNDFGLRLFLLVVLFSVAVVEICEKKKRGDFRVCVFLRVRERERERPQRDATTHCVVHRSHTTRCVDSVTLSGQLSRRLPDQLSARLNGRSLSPTNQTTNQTNKDLWSRRNCHCPESVFVCALYVFVCW